MVAVNDDLANLHADVHGPPWDRSVRGRLHELETDKTAAKAAEAALIAAKEVRDDRSNRAWTKKEKKAALALASAAVITPYVLLFLQ